MTAAEAFAELCRLVAQLRAPGGCPWDQKQTNETLLPKLIEEAYEVGHAIRSGDDANLREELGDVMLLVVMHAQIASERGEWSIREVCEEIAAKLVRRHPHVFADSKAHDADSVVTLWDSVKRKEKKESSGKYLEGVAAALPALMRAQKIQKKAAHVKFDWPSVGEVMEKVDEELEETRSAIREENEERVGEEIGDLLFAVVNLARKRGHDAEALLERATDKFVTRFHAMETELAAQGHELGSADLATLDEIWNAQKAAARDAR